MTTVGARTTALGSRQPLPGVAPTFAGELMSTDAGVDRGERCPRPQPGSRPLPVTTMVPRSPRRRSWS